MSRLQDRCASFRLCKIIGSTIEPYGIVRVRNRSVPEDQFAKKGGLWCFADTFHAWRKADPNAMVRIIYTTPDPLFELVDPKKPEETDWNKPERHVHPISVFHCLLYPLKLTIQDGGYIIRPDDRNLAKTLLAAEQGQEPEYYDNTPFLRYPRDHNFLRRAGFSSDPPIGTEVVVLKLVNFNHQKHYRVFTTDEKLVPFEIAPDLISYERWGRKPQSPQLVGL